MFVCACSEVHGHENPVFLGGSPQIKTRTVSQIMARQSSETGRHLLSEPGTPLSPPAQGDVFFPVEGRRHHSFSLTGSVIVHSVIKIKTDSHERLNSQTVHKLLLSCKCTAATLFLRQGIARHILCSAPCSCNSTLHRHRPQQLRLPLWLLCISSFAMLLHFLYKMCTIFLYFTRLILKNTHFKMFKWENMVKG